MKKCFVLASLTLAFSGYAMAGTGLNCAEMAKSDSFQTDGEFSQCLTQTDQELNASFKTLQTKMKDRNAASDLKAMLGLDQDAGCAMPRRGTHRESC